jgi:AcrR family transcriptional regulator
MSKPWRGLRHRRNGRLVIYSEAMAQPSPRPTDRDAIHATAARMFREQGYARTTIPAIAAASGVSPALVLRHFRSKELLFLETMQLTIDKEPLLDVPLSELGVRLAEMLMDLDHRVRDIFLALVRGSTEPRISELLSASHETAFVQPLRARLTGPGAELRARLAGALAGGLLYALWVARDEGLLAADRGELTTRYGALFQQVLTPPP